MTRPNSLFLPGLLVLSILAVPPAGAEESSNESSAKYTLRYKLQPGEILRWQVVHRALVKTIASGSTQTAEMVSKSIKAWHVKEVKDDGSAVFENMVESVDMRQKLTGRQEIRYNSRTDKEPPPEFAMVAESVGVKLSTITLSPSGEVIHRKKEKVQGAAQNERGEVTITFPEEPIAVGRSWSFPYDITLPTNNGTTKTIRSEQKFTLEGVKTGIATIRVATVILTPIHDPAVEAQLIQHQSSGTVRFDMDAGRVIGQQMDLDKRVVGFIGKHSPTSSLHYLTRFTEEFLASETASADEKTDGTKTKTTTADEKTDSTKTKTATADEKTDSTKTKTAAADEKTDSTETKTASADEKTDNTVSKTAAGDEKTDNPESKTAESENAVESDEKQSVAAKPDVSEVKK